MLLATTADTVVLSEESSSRSCLFSSLSCLFSSLNSERSFLSLAFSASSSSTVGKSLRYKGKQDTAKYLSAWCFRTLNGYLHSCSWNFVLFLFRYRDRMNKYLSFDESLVRLTSYALF